MISVKRRKLIAGGLASLVTAPSVMRLSHAATLIRPKNRIFTSTPDIVNLFTPLANTSPTLTGVMPADLMPDGFGPYPQRMNLGNFRGKSLIPPEAYAFNLECVLFRAPIPAGSSGVDVSLLAMLDPTAFGLSTFSLLAQKASGPWVEQSGRIIEFPNYTDAKGRNRCGYWQVRGNAGALHAIPWIRLVSYDVPDSYVTPTDWPVRNPGPSSLMMYFGGDGFTDASPFARTVTAHNSTIQGDGSASFNGTSSYLSFAGNDSGFNFTGDFTIETTIATNSKSNPHDGNDIRILSFGGLPSLAVGIDHTTGAIVVFNEYTSRILTGSVNVCNTGGNYHTIKVMRESGLLTLHIDGMQDGQGVADTTHWAAAATSEIGRLCGQNMGMFVGNMLDLNVVNGVAL